MGNLTQINYSGAAFSIPVGGGGTTERGSYSIETVYAGSTSGSVNSSHKTQISVNGTDVVWVRDGRFFEAVIRVKVNVPNISSSQTVPFFDESDIIGDGKMIPAGKVPVFTEVTYADNVFNDKISSTAYYVPALGLAKLTSSSQLNGKWGLSGTQVSSYIPSYAVGKEYYITLRGVIFDS